MGALAVAAVVAVAVATRSGDGAGDDGEGDRTAASGEDGWVYEEGGNSHLLAADDELVCSTDGSHLYCVDARTGDEVFTRELNGVVTPPVLLGDRVLVGSSRERLLAVDRDGEQLWTAGTRVDAERELPVVDGMLAVEDDGRLVGVDVSTGETAWQLYTSDEPTELHVSGSDTYTDGTRVYAAVELVDVERGSADGHIVAVDPASGAEVWRSPLPGDIGFGVGIAGAAPFEDGSAVAFLMQGSPRRVVVLDTATGQMRWEAPIASDYASIVHAEGMTVVADGPETRAYDGQGRQVWAVPSPVIQRSPTLIGPGELVFDQGRLFVAGYDVYELDPATGASELVRESVSATDAAVVGDLLVFSGMESLVALPLSSLGG